ncbi:MAG TPA: alpha-glucosidase C-terminal domain-containing protein [Candidatus Adamsella sp.]|nr:alpha-glucosidase C-terminal domain-containing protein [Candidatus Adamsella sp.]
MYKKLLSSILATSMLMSYSAAFASDESVNKNTSQKTHLNAIKENIKNKLPIKSAETVEQAPVENVLIPKKLEESMKASISHIYGKEQVDIIYPKIVKIIEKAKSERNPELLQDDFNRASDWYKDEVVYMFYPDQFGVDGSGKPATFKTAIGMLDYLKDLGVTTIYVLPFADSPMNDSGFDVKDPKNVRADLGGMPEFKEFAHAARKKGFKLKADLILNHFSDQHEWFQQALKGDLEKLHYFIVREDMPEYKQYKDPKYGYMVEYKEKDGTITKRRLIFPEINDNHYRKVTINNKDYYVYHTFYPFQPDVNWENPEVLYYMLDTISFWANLGIDIFRMDAIPYYIKEEGTTAENLPKTHEIIQLISSFLQTIAPRSVIQAEACQQPKKILPYFGTEKKVEHVINNKPKEITRTNEVQIAYHFPYMPAIWASLISADNSYFWKAYKQTPKIPDSAAWGIFLRVHDELTLEMVNEKTRELIYEGLVPKGAEFRKGYGVSGRLANFLDNNPERIGMAFSILLSMPGVPIIYYGDEIGVQNNFYNAKKSAKIREAKEKQKNQENKVKMLSYFDSRDINRGPIAQTTFYNAMKNSNSYNHKVYERVQKLIKIRKQNPVMRRGTFTEIKTDSPEVFAYVRGLENNRVVVINNLSDNRVRASVNFIDDDFGKKSKDVFMLNLLTGKMVRVKVQNKKLTVRLKPYDALWLKL